MSSYPQMTIRMSEESRSLLDAIVGMTGRPIWRVIDDALRAYVKSLPEDERTLLTRVQRRRAKDAE